MLSIEIQFFLELLFTWKIIPPLSFLFSSRWRETEALFNSVPKIDSLSTLKNNIFKQIINVDTIFQSVLPKQTLERLKTKYVSVV